MSHGEAENFSGPPPPPIPFNGIALITCLPPPRLTCLSMHTTHSELIPLATTLEGGAEGSSFPGEMGLRSGALGVSLGGISMVAPGGFTNHLS